MLFLLLVLVVEMKKKSLTFKKIIHDSLYNKEVIAQKIIESNKRIDVVQHFQRRIVLMIAVVRKGIIKVRN